MPRPINLDAGVVHGSFAEARLTVPRPTQGYAPIYGTFSWAFPAHHPPRTVCPPLAVRPPPPMAYAPRYFGGVVTVDANLPAAVQQRVNQLARQFVLTRAFGDGDCGYNAFLGCLLHAIAARSDDGIAMVEGGFASLSPNLWPLRITCNGPFMDRAHQGHRQLLSLLRLLRTSHVAQRRSIVADFCASPAFARTVTFLRGCTAQRQMAAAQGSDFHAITRHVAEHTLVAGDHASWFEMQALAEALNVDLFAANPKESDQFCISTRSQGWATIMLLCWAEGRFQSGHFDGLLPR